jgi:prevent-host-death family protein
MRKIQLRDAKARFSAVVAAAVQGEPSMITRHGRAAAVIISVSEWETLRRRLSPERQPVAEMVEPQDHAPVAG